MCIRDRVGKDRSLRSCGERRRLGDLDLGDKDPVIEGDDWAVSYTHLRAHETVLDLVCRLLLEKKNESKHDHKQKPLQ